MSPSKCGACSRTKRTKNMFAQGATALFQRAPATSYACRATPPTFAVTGTRAAGNGAASGSNNALANLYSHANYRRGIKPYLANGRRQAWASTHERSSRPTQALHFCWGDCLERVAKVGAATGLDFTHREHTITPGDHIEFAAWAAPVAGNYLVALAHVPGGNQIFGKSRTRLVG